MQRALIARSSQSAREGEGEGGESGQIKDFLYETTAECCDGRLEIGDQQKYLRLKVFPTRIEGTITAAAAAARGIKRIYHQIKLNTTNAKKKKVIQILKCKPNKEKPLKFTIECSSYFFTTFKTKEVYKNRNP